MGNIFYCFFEKKSKFDDSLLKPLNEEYDYASILDFNNINSKVSILEKTTQNSFININKDVKYLFNQIEIIKKEFTELKENNINIDTNPDESIYYEPKEKLNIDINEYNKSNKYEETY